MKKILYILLMNLIFGTSVFAISGEQIILGDNLFGTDVAIHGDWAVVGIEMAPVTLIGTTYPELGMISIYKKNPAGNWELKQNIQETTYTYAEGLPGTQVSMHYGHSVDIYNDLIIVGAPDFDSDRSTTIGPDGMGFIYQLNPTTEFWEKVAELKPVSPIDVPNNAGRSVSISENWAVIGDDLDRHPTSSSGAYDASGVGSVAVYQKVGDAWVYHTELRASDAWGTYNEGINDKYGDRFGYCVDVYNDMIAVSAWKKGVETGGPFSYTGKVYIYEWDGTNWNETGITSPSPETHSEFASSISLYNGQLVVGAPDSDIAGQAGINHGAFYYYDNYSGNWSAGTKITASNMQNEARFGQDIDIYGAFIGVSAPSYNDPVENEGRAYIFDINDSFNETDNFSGSDTDTGDAFGHGIAISSEDILVSAIYTEHNNANGTQGNDGTAYFNSRIAAYGGSWTGTVSIDWNDPANWADGHIPNAITDVNIPAAAPFMPTIANGNAECRSMTIEAGAIFTNGNSGQLQINGDLVCHGNMVNTQSYYLRVEGTTLFDGAGVQNVPAGTFHEFTFDAGVESVLQGDIEIIGRYHHNSSKNLKVLDNIFTIHGNFFGTNDRGLKFNETSSLFITGSLRFLDFILKDDIRKIYNLGISVEGNHDDVIFIGSLEVYGTLSLYKGNLVLGDLEAEMNSTLTLNRPIYISNGNMTSVNLSGKTYGIWVNSYNAVYGDFILPSGIQDIPFIGFEYSGVAKLSANLKITDYIYFASSSFEKNGFDLSFDADTELWLGSSLTIDNIILNAGNLKNIYVWGGAPTLEISGQITGALLVHTDSQGLTFASGSSVEVTGTTTLYRPITLKSDANGRANFIDNGVTYSAKGGDAIFHIEQYIDSKEKWHYVSTPVKNSTANFFAGAYLNYYDTDLSDWVAFTSLDQAVNTMQGYSTKLPNSYSGQTLTFSGELNTAKDHAINISLSNNGNQFNLVGNPFPSTIDWDNANWTKNNIANAIYMWDPANARYASYVAGAGVNGGTRYIAANQGFFVQANGASPSLQIDNNDVRISQSQSFYKEDEIIELLSISLLSDAGQDEILIRFNEDASEEFDADFDAIKMFGNAELAQVYALQEDEEKMSIHSLKSIKETDFVRLGLQIETNGTYTLKFDDKNSLSEYVSLKIEDTKEETITELSLQDTYTFTYEEGENANRFILHFKDASAINDLDTQEQFAYYSNGSIYINNDETQGFESVQLINMAGQIIQTKTLGNESLEKMNISNIETGMYILHLISDNNTSVQKIMIDKTK